MSKVITRRYGTFYEQYTTDLLFHFVNKPLKSIYKYIYIRVVQKNRNCSNRSLPKLKNSLQIFASTPSTSNSSGNVFIFRDAYTGKIL